MLAAVYHGVGDIQLEEVPTPAIGADEILMRVRAGSICGTDLRIYSSGHFKIPPGTPRILGHELAGEVAEAGSLVRGYKPGMRITVAPNFGCGTCDQCIQGNTHLCPHYEALGITVDGAFAEYARIPAAAIHQGNVVPIPEGVSFEVAALNEPFSCCYNGSRACRIEPGDVVLIVGAGPIGIMHLLLARLSGARAVIVSETMEERLSKAREFGPDFLLNPTVEDLPTLVREVSGGHGADAIVIAAPSPEAQEQALDLAATHGRINFFGGLPKGREFIRFNSNRVHYKGISVLGTTGSNNYQFRRTLEILAARKIDLNPLISARFPLSRIQEGFSMAASKKALKVVINA